jgi:hypothetical protein
MSSSLVRAIQAALLVAACATPPPSPVASAASGLPEPVRPAARAQSSSPEPAGMVRAVAEGAAERFAIGMEGVRITSPQGTGASGDADAILADTRMLLAGLRFRAEHGGVTVEGPAPFAGRARSQTTGAVLRFSRASTAEDGGPHGVLTVEVRGDSVVGRVARRSSAGEEPAWTRSAFFAGSLRRE